MEKWTDKIFGIALGNTLIVYDFILYGFLGSTLSHLFFPHQSSFVALMSVFLVFASACLVRPLGAFLFGLIGDKYGRKTSLVGSVFLMALSSVLIGCLPTYQHIGELSVLLLVLLRVVQGLSMSGEEVGSAIYLIESAPDAKKSIAGSVVLASVHAGLFFGAALVWLGLASLSTASFLAWGWRIPFLLSLPLGMAALYFRLKQADSGDFTAQVHQETFVYPLREISLRYKARTLAGLLLCGLYAVSIYLYAVYIPNYLKTYHGFSASKVLLFSMASFVVSAASVVLVGRWGGKVGLLKPMKLACIAYIVLSPIAFYLLSRQAFINVVLAQLCFITIVALSSGTLMTLVSALFPVDLRFTGVATCFNFSMMIFGSTAPMIILALRKMSTLTILPALYMMLMGAVAWLALQWLANISREQRRINVKSPSLSMFGESEDVATYD
jgi:MFS transporter, MHS family, proline/betaine transporter